MFDSVNQSVVYGSDVCMLQTVGDRKITTTNI